MEVKTNRDFYNALLRSLPSGTPVKTAKELTEVFTGTLLNHINSGERVLLPGIGRFEIRATKPRIATNRFTGEKISVPAGKKLSFKPAHGLKQSLKGEAIVEESSDE